MQGSPEGELTDEQEFSTHEAPHETPDYLKPEMIEIVVNKSEWYGDDGKARERYLKDLRDGGLSVRTMDFCEKQVRETAGSDQRRGREWPRVGSKSNIAEEQAKTSREFTQAALNMAEEQAKSGDPGATAMFLFFARQDDMKVSDHKDHKQVLEAKCRLMATAHKNRAQRIEESFKEGKVERKMIRGLKEKRRESEKASRIYISGATKAKK